jgi:hypothetical protein
MTPSFVPSFSQLHLLFQNTLPLYSRNSEILATRFMIDGVDFHEHISAQAIQPAELTVLDGQNLLTGRPMLHGKWRRNGMLGTAELATGLMELLRDGARKDDAALVMLSPSIIRQSNNGHYFPLFRLHIDRVPNMTDHQRIQLLIAMRRRTQALITRVEELFADTEQQALQRMPGKQLLQVLKEKHRI